VDSSVHTDSVSMLDELHILTLAFILAGLIVNTHCWRWSVTKWEAHETEKGILRIETVRRRSLGIGGVAYVVLTVLLIMLAVHG
jgi:hypothetical protein